MEAKLSVWSSYYVDLKIEDAVEELIKNGIFCSELSDEHGLELLERSSDVIATGNALREFLTERGFEISQGHLWLYARICSDGEAVATLLRWIDLYEAIGIRNMVLHCDKMENSKLSEEERFQKNVEKLSVLADYIRGRDIIICLENIRATTQEEPVVGISAEQLLKIIDRIGSEQIGICLDTGHLNLTLKNQREFILKAGKKLKALHIADNRGQTDEHLMPFNGGTVDFRQVVDALRQVDYRGLFNLEIPGERRLPLELRAAKLAYIRACYDYLMKG